jgi:hypothetical protein
MKKMGPMAELVDAQTSACVLGHEGSSPSRTM